MILELKQYSNISSVTCDCASLYLKRDKNYTRQLVGPHLKKNIMDWNFKFQKIMKMVCDFGSSASIRPF